MAEKRPRRWGIELKEGPAARSQCEGARVIRTARTQRAINAAVVEGFFPLVKLVEQSPEVSFLVGISQDPVTGQIFLLGDRRSGGWDETTLVSHYYPYKYPSPFAAYLLPTDLMPGERVWLEDLIEDVVAVWGNQGYCPRLACAPAVWNGRDFDIEFDANRDAETWLG